MATPKVMKQVDPSTGEMECRVCGAHHFANHKRGGLFVRGSWHCVNGCKLPERSERVLAPLCRPLDDARRDHATSTEGKVTP